MRVALVTGCTFLAAVGLAGCTRHEPPSPVVVVTNDAPVDAPTTGPVVATSRPADSAAVLGRKLVHVIIDGDAKQALALIEAGADVKNNTFDDDGTGLPLYFAAAADEEGMAQVVRALVARGADINRGRADSNESPLHAACLAVNAKMAKLLIELGADVNARDRFGATPLHYATYNLGMEGAVATAEVLLAHGAEVNVVERKGNRTPLDEAYSRGSWNVPRRNGLDPRYSLVAVLRAHGAKHAADLRKPAE